MPIAFNKITIRDDSQFKFLIMVTNYLETIYSYYPYIDNKFVIEGCVSIKTGQIVAAFKTNCFFSSSKPYNAKLAIDHFTDALFKKML